MLTVRHDQVAVLAAASRDRFVVRLCDHARRRFANEVAALSIHELHQAVRDCLDRALRHGVQTERDACRYLNLALAYGWNFDQDPDLLWIRRRLADASDGTVGERLAAIVQDALHRERVIRANRDAHWPFERAARLRGRERWPTPFAGPLMQGLLFPAMKPLLQVPPRDEAAATPWTDDLPGLLTEFPHG